MSPFGLRAINFVDEGLAVLVPHKNTISRQKCLAVGIFWQVYLLGARFCCNLDGFFGAINESYRSTDVLNATTGGFCNDVCPELCRALRKVVAKRNNAVSKGKAFLPEELYLIPLIGLDRV